MSGGYGIECEQVLPGVTRIKLKSRLTHLMGFHVCCYLVEDLLVDSGFAKAAPLLMDFLSGKAVRAVACTHHHEDHTGSAGLVADSHGCPVYLWNPEKRFSEGLSNMKPYRLLWWGRPARYSPEPMPEVLESGSAAVRALPTPGHSATHCVLFEPRRKVLFSGDIFITGGATAVLCYENPYQLAESLRKAAKLEPRIALNGHGLLLRNPVEAFLEKAEAIERAADRAVWMFEQGMAPRAIATRLFSSGHLRDRTIEVLTQGEFSRLNFVLAAIRHRPG